VAVLVVVAEFAFDDWLVWLAWADVRGVARSRMAPADTTRTLDRESRMREICSRKATDRVGMVALPIQYELHNSGATVIFSRVVCGQNEPRISISALCKDSERWSHMSDTHALAIEEYRALRATIRERGTARLIVTVITFVAWSASAVAVQALFTIPTLTLAPLIVLAAGFEVVFAAHVGVERIGRFLYVHYESGGNSTPCWEHAVVAIGTHAGGSGIDPLCSVLFIIAALANLVPAVFAAATLSNASGVFWSLGFFAVVHAIFIVRVLGARRFAASQRPRDTQLFQEAARAGH
jgi:hypothetical protein